MTTVTSTPPVERGRERLSRTLMWSYAYTTGGYIVTALLQLGLAAVLSPRQFGVMTLAMLWVVLALVLLEHGPTMAVVQQNDITDNHLDAAFWSTLGGSLLFAGVFAAVAPLWAAANGLPEMTAVCLALAPVIPLTALNAIPNAVLRRKLRMKQIAVRVLASSLIGGVAGLACAVAGLGVWALVVQQLVTPVIGSILLWHVTDWRPRLPRRATFGGALRDLRGTSLHTISGAIGYFISTRTDAIVMGQFLGPAPLGHYRFAQRFSQMALDVTARGVQHASLPELSRHNDEPALLAGHVRRLTHLGVLLSVPILAVFAAAARPFALFVGSQWADAVGPLRILCAFYAIGVVSNLLVPALQAAQRPGLTAAFTWTAAAISVAGLLLAVRLTAGDGPQTRLTAIALSALAMEALITGAMVWVTFGRVLRQPMRPFLGALAPGFAASGLAFGTGWFVERSIALDSQFLAFIVVAAAGFVVAAVCLVLFDPWVRGRVTRLVRPPRPLPQE